MKHTRHTVVLLLLSAVCFIAWSRTTTVVDKESRLGVGGVTVFSQSGRIIGRTDSCGKIDASDAEYPLTLRCLGYEGVTADADADTVLLVPRDYAMDPVVVCAKERPITRLTGYVREYTTAANSTDTSLNFTEYMVDMYLAPSKTKGYRHKDASPHIRNKRCFRRMSTSDGRDSIDMPAENELALGPMLLLVPDSFSLTKRMKQGAAYDQKPGKYSPAARMQNDGKLLKVSFDPLSAYKDHKMSSWLLKIFGLNIEITKFDVNVVYKSRADTTAYRPVEMIESTTDAVVLGTGKWIKKYFNSKEPVAIQVFMEFYPSDISHLTIDEYKELRESDTSLPWHIPATAAPLPAAYSELIRRCTP